MGPPRELLEARAGAPGLRSPPRAALRPRSWSRSRSPELELDEAGPAPARAPGRREPLPLPPRRHGRGGAAARGGHGRGGPRSCSASASPRGGPWAAPPLGGSRSPTPPPGRGCSGSPGPPGRGGPHASPLEGRRGEAPRAPLPLPPRRRLPAPLHRQGGTAGGGGGRALAEEDASSSLSCARRPLESPGGGPGAPPESLSRSGSRSPSPAAASLSRSGSRSARSAARKKKKARKRDALQAMYAMWQQAQQGSWPLPFMGGQPGGMPFGVPPGGMAYPGYGWLGRDPGGHRDDPSVVHIPRRHVGKVIGKQGSIIKGIREMSGARINVDDKDDAGGPTCRFHLSGTPEQIARAKAMIAEVTPSAVGGNGARPGDVHVSGAGRSRSRDRGDGWRGGDAEHEGPITSIEVEQTFMGRIIGRQGANITRLRKSTGAVITASKLSEDRTIIKISGREEAVERATSEINGLIDRSKQALEEGGSAPTEKPVKSVTFPAAIFGGIIGVGGAKIKEARAKTGARILVTKVDDRTEVRISGKEDAVTKAEAAIRVMAEEALEALKKEALEAEGEEGKEICDEDGKKLASDKGADGDTADETMYLTLSFPAESFGSIVGTRGAKIQDIRLQSGAKVNVDKIEAEDICKVKISGKRDQVQQAKGLVESMAADPDAQPSKSSQPRREKGGKGGKGSGKGKMKGKDYEQVIICIPKTVLGLVIGKAGANIKGMMQDSGAHMRVNSQDDDPCPMRIAGTSEQVRNAKVLLSDLLENTGVTLPELQATPPPPNGTELWRPDQGGFAGYPMGGFGALGGFGGPMGALPGGFGAFSMPGPWGLGALPGAVRGRSPGPGRERRGDRGRSSRRARDRGSDGTVASAPAEVPSAKDDIDLDEL